MMAELWYKQLSHPIPAPVYSMTCTVWILGCDGRGCGQASGGSCSPLPTVGIAALEKERPNCATSYIAILT